MAAVVVRSSSPDEPRSKLVRNDRVVDVSALLLAHGARPRPRQSTRGLRAPVNHVPSVVRRLGALKRATSFYSLTAATCPPQARRAG